MSMTVGEAGSRQPKPVPDTPENVLQQFTMKGKVVAVNGAADGIGLAVAEAMAEAGANVAMWYNSNTSCIDKAASLADKQSVKAKAYQVEVSDHQKVEEAIAQVVEDFGKLDVFVANAGAAISKTALDMTIDEYRHIMSVNVDGVFYCAKYAGAVFKKQGFGNLIITSSISAHIVNVPVDQPVYNTSKAAISHLGKSLAREWREFARVNVVSPGWFDTKMGASADEFDEVLRMTPLGRQGDVKEIKGLYLYLASDASSYQTGSDVLIDECKDRKKLEVVLVQQPDLDPGEWRSFEAEWNNGKNAATCFFYNVVFFGSSTNQYKFTLFSLLYSSFSGAT